MDPVMMASFVDELFKIATLSVTTSGAKSAIGRPSSLTQQEAKATPSLTAMKPQTRLTDYTQVNRTPSRVSVGTADASKAVPTPPVIA